MPWAGDPRINIQNELIECRELGEKEFPSLSHLAETGPAALAGIMKLVGTVLSDMVRSKEEIPEPLSLRQFKGNIAVRVPPERHRELAMEAAEQGVSLNRLISDKLAR